MGIEAYTSGCSPAGFTRFEHYYVEFLSLPRPSILSIATGTGAVIVVKVMGDARAGHTGANNHHVGLLR